MRRHSVSVAVLNPSYAVSAVSGANVTGGIELAYAYGWSRQWSFVVATGAQRDREIINVFVGREPCGELVCNSRYRDYEVMVWSYSASTLLQRQFPISPRWSLLCAAGLKYIRGPESAERLVSALRHRLPSSSGKNLSRVSLRPQLVEPVVIGVAFQLARARVALELERSFGAENTLVDYSRPSAALRVTFPLH